MTAPIGPASPVPRLRKKRVLTLGTVSAALIPAVREVERTVAEFADWWDDHNAAALAGDGPLWVVLGDSASQGVGASHPSKGYVPRVLERLRTTTGEPWRAVNLSMTGAKMADVVDPQLSALNTLDTAPVLVTCLVGANDMLVPRPVAVLRSGARRLVDQLPHATVMSRVGANLFPRRPRAVNREFEAGVASKEFVLFEPWAWPTAQGAMARDRFHPNDLGYSFVADLVWQAVGRRLGLDTHHG